MTNEEMLKNKSVYREQIIKENLGLVYKLAHKFVKYRSWDNEFLNDLIGEGCIGLCKAVDYYDASKNIKFSTLASTCIINAFYTYIRNTNDIKYEGHYVGKRLAFLKNLDESKLTKRQKNSLQTFRRIAGGQVDLIGDENGFENLEAQEEKYLNEEEFKELLNETEGEFDKYILRNFHKQDREIANTFNVSAQTVANHRKKVLRNLQEKL